MPQPSQFLIEGLDRLGKDMLILGLQHRLGYHQVLHYQKPVQLDFYAGGPAKSDALRRYQEASFRTMFQFLCETPSSKIICNRAHLGETVYAPMYRNYSGEYVFELEREFKIHQQSHVRLVLLTEDFSLSKHFVDDRQSLGDIEKRQEEQGLFLNAFATSMIQDRKLICVTDSQCGHFRNPTSILDEVLS